MKDNSDTFESQLRTFSPNKMFDNSSIQLSEEATIRNSSSSNEVFLDGNNPAVFQEQKPLKKTFSTKICSTRLVLLNDRSKESFFELSMPKMQLGRATYNDIIIPDPCISAKHCIFEQRPNGVWLCDLNSANGTFVNGQLVSECHLKSGDIIRCGTSILKFEMNIKRPQLSNEHEKSLRDPPKKIPDEELKKSSQKQKTTSAVDLSFKHLLIKKNKSSDFINSNLRLFLFFVILATVILIVTLIYFFRVTWFAHS
jgi:hypothetical protein